METPKGIWQGYSLCRSHFSECRHPPKGFLSSLENHPNQTMPRRLDPTIRTQNNTSLTSIPNAIMMTTTGSIHHHLFALTFNTSPPNSPRFHFLISFPHNSHNLASNSALRFASSLFFSDEEGERFLNMPPRFSGVLTFLPRPKGWKRGLKRLDLMGD